MSLATPAKLRRLQRALYGTAKQEPGRRFHVLHDKVWREDILAHAFALSRENGGAPGVDGVTFAQIEANGVARWLGELREDVRTGRVRRHGRIGTPCRGRCVMAGMVRVCANGSRAVPPAAPEAVVLRASDAATSRRTRRREQRPVVPDRWLSV